MLGDRLMHTATVKTQEDRTVDQQFDNRFYVLIESSFLFVNCDLFFFKFRASPDEFKLAARLTCLVYTIAEAYPLGTGDVFGG
jgi:hypothetical protein